MHVEERSRAWRDVDAVCSHYLGMSRLERGYGKLRYPGEMLSGYMDTRDTVGVEEMMMVLRL